MEGPYLNSTVAWLRHDAADSESSEDSGAEGMMPNVKTGTLVDGKDIGTALSKLFYNLFHLKLKKERRFYLTCPLAP